MKESIFPNTNKFFMKLNLLFKTSLGRLFLLTSFTFPLLSNLQLSLIIFMCAYVIDFFTGWLASYIEIKNGVKPMPNSGYVFESGLARQSVVKGVGYALFILAALAFEVIFFDKKISLTHLTSKSMGITELSIGLCTVIEVYSALIENMTRAGFDLIGKVKTITSTVWDLINRVKGDE